MDNYLSKENEDMTAIENYKVMMELSEEIFHDFKNILATISGLAQLSMISVQSDEVKNYLSNINKATFDFRDTLDKYYSYTSGNSHEEDKPFILNEIINKSIEMVQFRLNKPNHIGKKIILDIKVSTNSKVKCGEYELKQSFLNIMMNAIDSMENSGGTLTINIYNNEDNSYIITEIIDSGIGIPEENIEKIFVSKFTTKERGTGLGLRIAKNCVERLGGTLKLSSKANIGTKVEITLPIYHED